MDSHSSWDRSGISGNGGAGGAPQIACDPSAALTERQIDVASRDGTNVAAHYLVTRVPRARPYDHVQAILRGLPGRRYDSTDAVYVLDDQERLIGVVPLSDVFNAPP